MPQKGHKTPPKFVAYRERQPGNLGFVSVSMTRLKLPKQGDRRTSEVTLSLSSDLRNALEKYGDLYRATYGEEIFLEELILAMLEEFLTTDSAFVTKHGSPEPPPPTLLARPVGSLDTLPTPAVEKLISLKDVCHLIGVGKTMVYRMIQEGRFPAPYKPSPKASRWSEREVIAWISSIKSRG